MRDHRLNPALSFIHRRRSVRRFSAGPMPEDTIRDLLEAAMAAPSAVAKDPWHFVAVRQAGTLAAIAEVLPNGKMLPQASLGVVVCGEQARAHDAQLSYLLQDCSAAIENLLLAASALGLGACWLGVHPREERIVHLRQVLGIPEAITPLAVVAIGHPGEDKAPRTRYDATRVHHERW